VSRIFISYRRQESSKDATALFERLARHFGTAAVFMDVEGIALGVDFQEVLDRTLDTCRVMLLLMGPNWAEIKDEAGERRLDDPNDFVRIEVATALRREIPLIPVFIDGARMPKADRLPPDLVGLPRRQGMPIDQTNWRAQTAQLIKALERWFEPQADAIEVVSQHKPGTVLRDGENCPEMVVIAAGEFMMGSPKDEEGRWDNEGPQHKVKIARAFALGRYAVTVGEFRRFVAASAYETEAEGKPSEGLATLVDDKWDWSKGKSWRDPGFPQDDRHPVVGVSWNDALAYARWLAKETGKTYRLPSEAEWEYAARAGTTTSHYWGDEPNQACRYANVADRTAKAKFPGWTIHDCDDGYVYTAPVGSFQPNAFGLYDMIGNVWEWTQDCWNESYQGAPTDGSAWGMGDCGRRVVRGGSWGDEPQNCRCANRGWVEPGGRVSNLGFRLARTL
jgi:formylglycine-generating enzyme required for sulfatase activity